MRTFEHASVQFRQFPIQVLGSGYFGNPRRPWSFGLPQSFAPGAMVVVCWRCQVLGMDAPNSKTLLTHSMAVPSKALTIWMI